VGTQHQLCHLAGLHYHDLAEDHVNGRLLDHEAPPFLAVPASSRRSGLTGVMPKKGRPAPDAQHSLTRAGAEAADGLYVTWKRPCEPPPFSTSFPIGSHRPDI